MGARIAAYAFAATTLAIHGVVAWLSPIQGDDWGHLMWAQMHDGVADLVLDHLAFSDLVGYVLARSTLVHTVVSPLVGLALVWGVFTIAARRLPRLDDWPDVTALVVLASLTWIAAPRAGLVWFHRPYVAMWIYGAAVALWFLAPYRCRWQPRGAWVPLVGVAGYCAGSSTRQIATVALFAVIYAIRRTAPAERARWMWVGLAGVTLGTVVGFVEAPIDFRGFKAGFEGSLTAIGLSMREGGELIALLLGLVMVKLVLARVRPRWAGEPGGEPPDTSETLRWLWVWIALTVLALLGPRYSEATLFASALALVIATLPLLQWLLASRVLRVAVIAIAIGIHLVVWVFVLATYIPRGAEYRVRIAKLASAPAGGVATIDPYDSVRASFWFFGEDFAEASSRQLIAIELFGLRDIEMSTAFGSLETNARIAMRFELEGATAGELAAAKPPPFWGTEVATARGQFERLTRDLEDHAGRPFSARMVVADFALAELRGRPLLVAAYDAGEPLELRTSRVRPDDKNMQAVTVKPEGFLDAHREAYLVVGGRVSPIALDKGKFRIQTMTTDLHAIIACEPRRCFLVDAFVPQL